MDEKYASLGEHLKELRKVVLWSVLAVVLGTVICYGFFIEQAMNLLTAPIEQLGYNLKFISVSEGFMAHIKVAVLGGFILASPVVCWQLMSFILPALYKHERKIFYILLFLSVLLFLVGIAFAYFIVLDMALFALLNTLSGDFIPEITANYYISFVLKFMVPFGIVFEIPLFVYFLTKVGIVNPDFLVKNRKYVVLIMLILAAMLTPPDIISQLMLGLPMYVLYEISILISKRVYKRKLKKAEKQARKEEKNAAKEEKNVAKEENGKNLISDDEHTKTSDECDNSIEIVAQESKANEEEI